jgi:hypothetical protein
LWICVGEKFLLVTKVTWFFSLLAQGRVKVVAENRSGVHADPTPKYDSHMAKSSLDQSPASEKQIFELYQVCSTHDAMFSNLR